MLMPRGASATVWIMAVNTVVFLTVWISGIPAEWTGLPSGFRELAARPWTPLSYMFVHYSFWHLLVNMMWLWMFGAVLELTMPGRWVWRIYLAGGISGALLYMLWGGIFHPGGILCGASASVTAVMTAAGLRSPGLTLRLWLIGAVRLKWVVMAGVALIFIGAGGGGFPAHLGGLASGAFMMMAVMHNTPIQGAVKAAGDYMRHRKDIAKGKRLRKAIEKRQRDMTRLDALLDRVRISGFDSLTADEKSELQRLSSELSSERVSTPESRR